MLSLDEDIQLYKGIIGGIKVDNGIDEIGKKELIGMFYKQIDLIKQTKVLQEKSQALIDKGTKGEKLDQLTKQMLRCQNKMTKNYAQAMQLLELLSSDYKCYQ